MDMERINPLWLPIVRFDEDKWTVTGQATVEDEDSYGTVFDYEASKRAFSAWQGNVREMHDSKKAVGRAIDVTYNDETRQIFVTTKVSRGAKDTWEKIKDGTLTGYSVGALAGKDDWGTIQRNGKSLPLLKNYNLAELSLVDKAATPGCDIQIVRADGFANDGVLMTDEEIDAATPVETPVNRAGAKVSHATQGDLHSIRNTALNQAQTAMGICNCDECQVGAAALDPDADGDIDIMDSTDYLDNGQWRNLEPAITRAIQPTLQRINGVLAQFIQQSNTHRSLAPVPTQVDMAPIERRLQAIEQNGAAVANIEALTRAVDAKLVEIKAIAERIYNQPVGGGPYANGAAMDKTLATQVLNGGNTANDMAILARMSTNGNLTEQERLLIAAQQIKLERGM